MKTYTQFINELKLPKPKNREIAKEFVRGVRGEPMNKDPLAGKEMSDFRGNVRGVWPDRAGIRGNEISYPPITSSKPKYNYAPGGLMSPGGRAYVNPPLTKPERANVNAYARGASIRNLDTDNMTFNQIRKKKRQEVYATHRGHTVGSRDSRDIIKPPTPRQQAISDKLNKIKNSKPARIAGKILSKVLGEGSRGFQTNTEKDSELRTKRLPSYIEVGHPRTTHIKGKWESKHVELYTKEHGGKMIKTPLSSDVLTHDEWGEAWNHENGEKVHARGRIDHRNQTYSVVVHVPSTKREPHPKVIQNAADAVHKHMAKNHPEYHGHDFGHQFY